MKELKAIQRYLREEGDSLAKSRVGKVFWRTSSFACACCLKMGSKVMEVQKELVAIKWLEEKLEVKVMRVWEDRDASTAELVQKLSRSTDKWGLDRGELAKVFAELHFLPDLDCMATRTSSVCRNFFSKGVCMHSKGQDFFAQKLEEGVKYFCCPPVKEAFRAGMHLISQKKVESILLVLGWVSAPFWVGLQKIEKFRRCIKKKYSFRSTFVVFNGANSVFGRKSSMNVVAFLLNSGKFLGQARRLFLWK
jgi:hypothetical protein